MKRWVVEVFFLQKVLNFERRSPMKKWTKKTFLKHTHTNLQRQTNKIPMFPENEGCFSRKKKKRLFSTGSPFVCSAAVYWVSPCLASIPRLSHHISRVCTSCRGYMKYRNSFCLFSSTPWRSDPLEDSDHYEGFTQGVKLLIQGNAQPVWHSCSHTHGRTAQGITQW